MVEKMSLRTSVLSFSKFLRANHYTTTVTAECIQTCEISMLLGIVLFIYLIYVYYIQHFLGYGAVSLIGRSILAIIQFYISRYYFCDLVNVK